MDSETARPSLKQLVFGDVDAEIANTRRVLERVPNDKLEWRPHEKSMTMGGLAYHTGNLYRWGAIILQSDGYDFGKNPPGRQNSPADTDEIMRAFEERSSTFRTALQNATDEALAEKWTLTRGEQVLASGPRAVIIRTMCLNHLAHHRGQLNVYLRLNDVPVPGIYGPSADEQLLASR